MAVLDIIFKEDRVISFAVDEHGDIHRFEFMICPHCKAVIDHDYDALLHVKHCSGDFDADA